jgi:hypothetical protein
MLEAGPIAPLDRRRSLASRYSPRDYTHQGSRGGAPNAGYGAPKLDAAPVLLCAPTGVAEHCADCGGWHVRDGRRGERRRSDVLLSSMGFYATIAVRRPPSKVVLGEQMAELAVPVNACPVIDELLAPPPKGGGAARWSVRSKRRSPRSRTRQLFLGCSVMRGSG